MTRRLPCALGLLFLAIAPLGAATLVSEYQFENNLNDSTSNHLNATGPNITYTTINVPSGSYAGVFNNQYATVSDNALQSFTSSFSLASWVYISAESTSQDAIVAKWGSNNGTRAYSLLYDCATNAISFTISSDGTSAASSTSTLSSSSTLSLNTWYHVAAVYSTDGTSASMTLYLNGVQNSTLTTGVKTSVYDAANALTIGSFYNNAVGERRMQGMLDDLRLYNGALTSQEVAQLAIPEPSALFLGVAGLSFLVLWRRHS